VQGVNMTGYCPPTCAPQPETLTDTNTNTISTPYVVNKISSAYLVGYNDAISYGHSGTSCLTLPNTTSIQNDCGSGYVDGVNKLSDPNFQHSTAFVNGILTVHNRERSLVGSPPLVWSDKLAANAKAWFSD
jgi:hypothetical protein